MRQLEWLLAQVEAHQGAQGPEEEPGATVRKSSQYGQGSGMRPRNGQENTGTSIRRGLIYCAYD